VRAHARLRGEDGPLTRLYLVSEAEKKEDAQETPPVKYPGIPRDANGVYRFDKGVEVPESLQNRAWFRARNLQVGHLAARRYDESNDSWVRLYEVEEATALPPKPEKEKKPEDEVPGDLPVYESQILIPRHWKQAGFFTHHHLHRGPLVAYFKENNVYHKLFDYSKSHLSNKGRFVSWTGKDICARCGITVDATLVSNRRRVCHLCLEELEREKALKDSLRELDAINAHPEDYVLLDVEAAGTMGAHKRDHIISISVIDLEGRMLLNTLVYSPLRISWGAQKVHHIKDEMLRGAPRWQDVYRVLAGILQDRKILAYGSSSDAAFLRQTNAWYDIPPVKNEFVCLEQLHTRLRGLPTATRLSRAFEAVQDRIHEFMPEGEELGEIRPHRADDDCLMTLIIMRALIVDYLREEHPYWRDPED